MRRRRRLLAALARRRRPAARATAARAADARADDVPVAEVAPAPAPDAPSGMPVELRALLALLALDLALGVWLRLHAEQWLAFFVTQVPVLGLAAAAWAILPEGAHEWVRGRLRRALGRRSTVGALLGAFAAFGTLSLVCSTVRVESANASANARLRVVYGARTRDDARAFAAAPSQTLDRLTSPIDFRVLVWPTGRRVWVYGRGLASPPALVFPWVPHVVLFPDAFDSLATVAALPTPELVGELRDAAAGAVLTVRDARDPAEPLAADTLRDGRGVLLAFPEAGRPDSTLVDTWRGYLYRTMREDPMRMAEDSAALQLDADASLRQWRDATVRLTRRPVVVHDTLVWELRVGGAVVGCDTLVVTHAITSLYLVRTDGCRRDGAAP